MAETNLDAKEDDPKGSGSISGRSNVGKDAVKVRSNARRTERCKAEKVNLREVVTPLEQNTLQLRGYRLSYKLGEGSYANVYRTDYSTTVNGSPVNQTLACKVIDAAKAPRDFVKKFLPRELDILNKINHPHLIHVHSIFQCKKKFFIFMRYAEEGDLLDYVLRRDISEGQARVWFRQLALAVQYLHMLDIVHRDIKCENVLLTKNMNVKLADFGFSRWMNSKALSCTYCGSLAYASPEILRGKPYCPKSADIWSLGVLLFVILNQSMPFSDDNVKQLFHKQMNGEWSFRSKIAKTVSDQVQALVKSMLHANPAQRCTIDQVVESDWIKMNPKLSSLNEQEREALNKATAFRQSARKEKAQQPKAHQPQSKKDCTPPLVVGPSKIGLASKCCRQSEKADCPADISSNVPKISQIKVAIAPSGENQRILDHQKNQKERPNLQEKTLIETDTLFKERTSLLQMESNRPDGALSVEVDRVSLAPENDNVNPQSTNLITPFSRISQLGKPCDRLQMSGHDASMSKTMHISNILGTFKQDSGGPSLEEIRAIDKSTTYKSNLTFNTIS